MASENPLKWNIVNSIVRTFLYLLIVMIKIATCLLISNIIHITISISELMVKSVGGYTIFYQTDNNVLPSMEQHPPKLK